MMRILYLGYAMPESCAEDNIAFSVAGNKMELGYLTQLNKYCDVTAVTVPAIAPFPCVKKLYVKEEIMKISDEISVKCVGFLNIPLFKQIWQAINVFLTARRILKESSEEMILMTYNAYPQVGTPARFLRKNISKKCAIIADLPFDDASTRSLISKAVFEKYNAQTRVNLLKYNMYILLNRKAADFIQPNAKIMIMEGAIDESEWTMPQYNGNREQVIYSGALTDYSGIKELIEAWKSLGDIGKELHIYGKGYLQEFVKNESGKNNIIYHGVIANEQMREIQRKAILLVNPRRTDSQISQYTFPSKVLEYLASGTPVLTTCLNGITEDYHPYLHFASTSSVKDLKESLESFFADDYDKQLCIAAKGREYVISEKTWSKQIRNVYEFLCD